MSDLRQDRTIALRRVVERDRARGIPTTPSRLHLGIRRANVRWPLALTVSAVSKDTSRGRTPGQAWPAERDYLRPSSASVSAAFFRPRWRVNPSDSRYV